MTKPEPDSPECVHVEVDLTFCYICGQPFGAGQTIGRRRVTIYHADPLARCWVNEPVHPMCDIATAKQDR